MRQIQIDGIKGNAKGLQVIDSVEIKIKANMLESTPENLRLAINGDIDETGLVYDVISGRTTIELTDYIDNIAWVGRLSGSSEPVIIIIENALSTGGLQLKQEDNKEGIIPLEFTAHFDPSAPTTVPFEIRFPKSGTLTPFNLADTPIIDNEKILLTFNDVVDETVPLNGFVAKLLGSGNTITAAARGVNNLNTVLLTLTTAPTSGQAVTIAYTKPVLEAQQVTSLAGGILATFAAIDVTNN
jgi:hypothetical protein